MNFYFMNMIKIFISLLFYIIIFKISSTKLLRIVALIVNTFMILEVIRSFTKEIKEEKDIRNLNRKIGNLNKKDNIISNYCKIAKENNEELIKIKHDMKNELQIAYAIISEDEEKATKLLDKMDKKLENITITNYCKNDLLNATLTIKVLEAKKNNVNLDIKIDNNIDFNMEEIDLCNLFSNILDNSIEATKKCDKKDINFCIVKRYNYVIIKCENTYKDKLDKDNNGKLITSKKDSKNHGHGMGIITDIVDKYNGEIKVTTKNDIFKIIILFTKK